MSLSEFCYIPSVGTDAFYTKDEQFWHNRLIRLYSARNKEKDGRNDNWRIKAFNRLIKKNKEKLSELLKKSLNENIQTPLKKKILSIFLLLS